MDRIVLHHTVTADDPAWVCDVLAFRTGLPKARIKDGMEKGCAWLRKSNGGARRVRRARTKVHVNDRLEFCYDRTVLDRIPPRARCLEDVGPYSVWYKPAGLMAQGTRFGDHCSLVRQAEKELGPSRSVFLVHRLDREAAGLMLLAHRQEAAAGLSRLLRQRKIDKRYRVEVLGTPRADNSAGCIDLPLDNKEAITRYVVESYDPERNTSILAVSITTGRKHQIRRHLAMIGHPVMGDPRYGSNNSHSAGLRLMAVGLAFVCPLHGVAMHFTLPAAEQAF